MTAAGFLVSIRESRVGGSALAIAIAACIATGPSPAADPPAAGMQGLARFDGTYMGTVTLTSARRGSDQGFACETNNLEQKMSITGGQVYLDRRFNNPNIHLLLSGTVSGDGLVSASGTLVSQSGQYKPVGAHLGGNLQGNEFSGDLSIQDCALAVKLRKTS